MITGSEWFADNSAIGNSSGLLTIRETVEGDLFRYKE